MSSIKLSFRIPEELGTALTSLAAAADQQDLSKFVRKVLEDFVAAGGQHLQPSTAPEYEMTLTVGKNRKFRLDPRNPNNPLTPLSSDRIAEMVKRNEEKLKAKKP